MVVNPNQCMNKRNRVENAHRIYENFKGIFIPSMKIKYWNFVINPNECRNKRNRVETAQRIY